VVINYAEGESAGPPLLLLHGGTGNWQTFEDYIPALERNWHAYACDLRGHGKSGRAQTGYAYDGFVRDIVAFVECCVGEPVVLLGHSLGASITLGVAARLPGLVRALVLLEPVLANFHDVGLKSNPVHGHFVWFDGVLKSNPSFEEVMARCKEFAPANDEAATRSMAQWIYAVDPQFVTSVLQDQLFKDYRPEELLPQVVCPTLLVYGEVGLGSVMNEADLAFFKEHVPRGIAVQVSGAGHDVPWGEPGQVTRGHVAQFLNSL
jgi:pimeloyl-ACP methyl ester carboxylesterase